VRFYFRDIESETSTVRFEEISGKGSLRENNKKKKKKDKRKKSIEKHSAGNLEIIKSSNYAWLTCARPLKRNVHKPQ